MDIGEGAGRGFAPALSFCGQPIVSEARARPPIRILPIPAAVLSGKAGLQWEGLGAMGLIRLLFSPSGWIWLGLIICGFGGYILWNALDRAPERSELIPFSGTVVNGTEKDLQLRLPKVGDLKTVKQYELNVVADDGKRRTLRLPVTILNADTFQTFAGLRVEGLLRDGRDDRVWEFTVGQTPLLSYAERREAHFRGKAADKILGLKIVGAGLGFGLLGFTWLYMRRRLSRRAYGV